VPGGTEGEVGHRQLQARIFFFLKKKEAKKTSSVCARPSREQTDESFLVLFYKKEPLPCFTPSMN
jgi:hypothetical protein